MEKTIVLYMKGAFYLRKVDFYLRKVNFTSQNWGLSHETTCHILEQGNFTSGKAVFYQRGEGFTLGQVGFYLRRGEFYLTKEHFQRREGIFPSGPGRAPGGGSRAPRSPAPRARPLVEPAANGEAAPPAPPRGCAGSSNPPKSRTPKILKPQNPESPKS